MGRVLSYSIKKETGVFSTKEKNVIISISDKYNSGQFERVWSCENFWLDPNEVKRCTKVSGCTKVQGNEFNALLIYAACIELSSQIKNSSVYLDDEGEFLYCPVRIKNGKASPEISSLKNDIMRFYTRICNNNTELQSKLITGDLPESLLRGVDVNDSCYSDESSIEYINEKLRNLDELWKRIKNKYDLRGAFEVYREGVESTFFSPELLCRPVNPNDFYGMEVTPATLMAGFNGEYWSLSNKDAEAESYRTIGMMQKMLGGAMENGAELKILGVKK